MIEINYCIYSSHDIVGRHFFQTKPYNFIAKCYFTESDDLIVKNHTTANSGYPFIGGLPSVLIKVPSFIIPERKYSIINEGIEENIVIPESRIQEHYEMLDFCPSYETSLIAVDLFQQNIKDIESGIRFTDPNPVDFLQQEYNKKLNELLSIII